MVEELYRSIRASFKLYAFYRLYVLGIFGCKGSWIRIIYILSNRELGLLQRIIEIFVIYVIL